jgi:hypothetical protein
MYFFEATCAVQLRAQAAGTLADGGLVEVHPDIVRGAAEQVRVATRGSGAGALVWPGLLRRLDRGDDSWRH